MPFNRRWIRKMWYIYTMEYYAAEKNNGILKFAGKWMELENVILSETIGKPVPFSVLQDYKDYTGSRLGNLNAAEPEVPVCPRCICCQYPHVISKRSLSQTNVIEHSPFSSHQNLSKILMCKIELIFKCYTDFSLKYNYYLY
ncbi:hypothetical protein STEG23_034812 [Scotinomys teguina]